MDHINITPQVAKLNINEHVDDIENCIRYINNDYDTGFKLLYYNLLDYVVPIAFQTLVCLHTDLKGNTINNVFDYRPTTKMNLICLCSFPLTNKTVLMTFLLNDSWKKYRDFVKQFESLNKNEKMLVLQNMAISHSEDVFIYPGLVNLIKEDNEIQRKFRLGFSDKDLYFKTGLITSLIIDSRNFLRGTDYFSQKYEIRRSMNEK